MVRNPGGSIGFVLAKRDEARSAVSVFVGIKLGSFWQKRLVFSSCYPKLSRRYPDDFDLKTLTTLGAVWCGRNVRSGRALQGVATLACQGGLYQPFATARCGW